MGLLKFLFHRLVRIDKDLVFEIQITKAPYHEKAAPIGELLIVSASNLDADEARSAMQAAVSGENAHYRQGLMKRDKLLAVLDKNTAVLHYSMIQFESRYKTILQEDHRVPLFTHCWTAPEARGKRLYPFTLQVGIGLLKDDGFDRALITCHPDNLASIKGIERAGFTAVRHITSLIILSRLAVQVITQPDGKKRLRFITLFSG